MQQLTFLQEDLLHVLQGKGKTAAKKPAKLISSPQPLLPLAAKPSPQKIAPSSPPASEALKQSAEAEPLEPTHEKTSTIEKSEDAFKTISEAANVLNVPQHVLRFWETKFPQIKPTKLAGGRRYYRPEDMDVLTKIHHLLYKQGYTIKGALKAFSKEPAPKNTTTLSQKISSLPKINIDKTKAHFTDRQLNQIDAIRHELMDLKEALRPYIY